MVAVATTRFQDLVAAARAGDPGAVARLLSLVEDAHPSVPSLAAELAPAGGRAWIVGLTGAPGVGKSTLTNELVRVWRSRRRRVAVLAIDPSSPFSGGAILGDRIRMREHALDAGVYIRSMSNRGHLGGVAAATPAAVRVLDGVGFDVVLVETVGVGQAEVEIASLADTTLVLLAPGMGDGVQAVKAGILEVADILVVNKADRDGAAATVRDLVALTALGSPASWRPPVLSTVAATRQGIDEVVAAVDAHRAALGEDGLRSRRQRRAAAEIAQLALTTLRARVAAPGGGPALDSLAAEVAAGRLDPYSAAARLLD